MLDVLKISSAVLATLGLILVETSEHTYPCYGSGRWISEEDIKAVN